MKLAIRYDIMIKYSHSAVGQFLAATSLPTAVRLLSNKRVVCIDLVSNTSRMWWSG